ncbi:MAG: molybdenum cofactor guanylyltransferase [Clostridiales bacterium]|nr:molybdenum cofactor guanylyltransferase [Clostridiales bacterium]
MSTAVILAGGLSLRMGFDKKELLIDNESLLENQIKTLSTQFDHILIISNKGKRKYTEYPKVTVYQDILKNYGPLGGIHAALKYSQDPFVYVIACDMPVINHKYIDYLRSLLNNQDAVVTRFGDWIEPFHAYYNQSMVDTIERYLKSGRRSIYELLKHQDVTYIEEDITRSYTSDWGLFHNINTKEDLNQNNII